jgi:hypothetical protein
MSRPPVSRERRVVYTDYRLAPRAGDIVATADEEVIRRERAALNDQAKQLQRRTDFGRDHETFELERT